MNPTKRISPASIEQIKTASIVDVVGHYVPLKKAGANLTACCPFHNEKSPSFIVSTAKDIYKCFGCGAGGDALRFVMEHEKQSFIEAVHTVAGITGIQLEYEEREVTEKEQQAITAAEAQEQVLNFVIPLYRQQLFDLPKEHPVKDYLYKRGFTDETIAEWQLGWAGTDWNFISSQIINKGLYEPAEKLGIVRRTRNESSIYDGYRSRITIPITDRSGRYIGLAGRFVELDSADKGKDYPKYINPAECEIYNKSAVLFGISKAAKAIKDQGRAVVVEGNFDVITPHTKGFENFVGISGTAFTKQQMQLLKKYTNRVALMLDNDDAGKAAFGRALPDLLNMGLQVEVVSYEGKDPDEYYNLQTEPGTLKTEDALVFRCRQLMEDAADDIIKKAEAKQVILELIAQVSNEFLRSNYFDTIAAKYKWHKSETKKQYEKIAEQFSGDGVEGEEEGGAIKIPDWVSDDQKEDFLKNGYIPVNRKVNGKPVVGYYSFNQNGKIEITNFIVQPLFHVYAGIESRYLLQVHNGFRGAVLDVPAKSIPSIDQFQAFTVSEGNFLIFGAKQQWLRIASDLLQKFPRCIELKNLGWQPFGFFAFVDKIYNPAEGLKELDNWGIYQHQTSEKQNYLIPASCEAYRQLQHTGEDPYENDRHLTFKKSPITFSQWADQMQRVYLQKGVVGVAAVILALFRDLVFDVDNNCPHIYAFGEPSSGKSKWAESITAVFYHRRPAFNLNSGTDFAFFSYMQRYRNAPAHLNEFEIEVIKPEWFQAIKGVYDGEGRERGKGGSKNRTEIMKVHSALVLTGQKLITADDNSVVTRSLIEPFSVREDLKEEDKLAYTKLKDWEAAGLSSILMELLQHRPMMQEKYKDSFNALLSQWRREHPESRNANQRILQNYAHLSTGYALMESVMANSLPQSAKEFTAYCLKQAMHWSDFIRKSDTLSEFWKTLEFLADQQQVHEGWDYVIEETTHIRIRKNRNEEVDHHLDHPTKVLYLRLNNVHKLFQTSYKMRNGKEAMNLENLLHYFCSRKYYIGAVKQKQFKRFVTVTENQQAQNDSRGTFHAVTNKKEQKTISSCYAFIYDELNIEIERYDGTEAEELPF